MRLKQKLDQWTKAGLLSREQHQAILAYEAEAGGSARVLVWAVSAVGGLAIVAGLVSLVAANWDEIPDSLKLAAGLSLLIGVALGALRLGERAEGLPRDLLLLVHQLLVLGMIGLVGQVFHLSGHPWRPLTLAAALAVPAAVAGRRPILVDVALAFSIGALGTGLDALGVWDRNWPTDILPLTVATALVLLCFSRVMRKAGAHAQARAPLRWSLGLAILGLAGAAAQFGASRAVSVPPSIVAYGVLVAAVVLTGVTQPIRARAWSTSVAAVLGLLLLLGPWPLKDVQPLVREGTGFVLGIGLCLALVFAAAEAGHPRGVSIATFALAARILWGFLELFDDLLTTGVGLVVTGLVLMGVAYGWWRLKGVVPVRRTDSRPGGEG